MTEVLMLQVGNVIWFCFGSFHQVTERDKCYVYEWFISHISICCLEHLLDDMKLGLCHFFIWFFFHHLMMIPSKWSKCLKSLFFSVWFIFGFSPTAPSWWKDGRISRRRLCKLIQIFIYMHILRIHAHTLMLNIFCNLFGFNSIYFESLQVIKTVKLQNLFAK